MNDKMVNNLLETIEGEIELCEGLVEVFPLEVIMSIKALIKQFRNELKANSKIEFDCPRMNGVTHSGKAHYEKRGEYRCCSHCGSMHPDDVLKAVEDLGPQIIGNTTKSYKRYITLPGVKNAGDGPIKFYTQHFSPEHIQKFNNLLWKGGYR